MAVDRVKAEIDLGAIMKNMEAMHAKVAEGTKIAAVIKADGYGHGALAIAKEVESLPYLWGFAVATCSEAISLIEAGRQKPVLILGVSFPGDYEDIIEHDIRPAIADYESAVALSKMATERGKTCRVHIKLDTGMGRIGFLVSEENADVIAQIAALPGIEIEGMFTHFAKADEEDKAATFEQMKLYNSMVLMLKDRGVEIAIKHCSNSAGIAEIPEANFDMVRAGITLYGLWPSDEVKRDSIELAPVMSLKSHVSFIKKLPAGKSISYGGTYTTDSDRIIATVPVGYGDGYSRGLSNKGYVLIRGKKAYICGRVCMDQFMVDVTDFDEVKVGDCVTLLGKDGDAIITMEELGELSGRFNYEFACLITPRVPRIYIR